MNGGGGSQLWAYSPGGGGGTGGNWSGPSAIGSYSLTPGATSTISYSVALSSLGLSGTETIYFDAYSSGGGGSDSAVDSLSNPNVSITSWSQTYTSDLTNGISSYTIPEPASVALFGIAAAGVAGMVWRRRRR